MAVQGFRPLIVTDQAHTQQLAAADVFLGSIRLPARTSLIGEILAEAATPEPSFDGLLARVSEDKILIQRLVTLANSAWFGAQVKVDSAAGSFSRLGLERFTQVAVCSVARHVMHEVSDAIWPHLEFTAQFSHDLAMKVAPEVAQKAYWAGLFHDYAVPFMAQKLTDYSYWTESALGFDHDLIDAEHECYGFDHAEVAGELARGWALGEDVAGAIEDHHRSWHLTEGLTETGAKLAALLVIAERAGAVAHHNGKKPPEIPFEPLLLKEAATALQMKVGQLEEQVEDMILTASARGPSPDHR